ncbi:MAG: bacterial Ig-like domain-containing protein [Clostridia bacterium]
MKNKKIVIMVVLALAIFALSACSLLANVASIDFTKAPKATYAQNEKVNASDFEVSVTFSDGTPAQSMKLDNALLTVEGLVDGKLDTATVGTKTLKITYQGVSISVSYIVIGAASSAQWKDQAAGDGKVLYDLLNSKKATTETVILTKNYDLAGFQWNPVDAFAATLDGAGFTIKNLTLTDGAATAEMNRTAAVGETNVARVGGLFGLLTGKVKNLKLDGVNIEIVSNDATSDRAKNFGCVAGETSGAANIENVTVTNAYIKANGRIGGIAGQNAATTTVIINNCSVSGTFVANNPISMAENDGEGDKVGGIFGQSYDATIKNCVVSVNIQGTRDLGGIAGFVTGKAVITGNTVVSGSIISATVPGGMLPSKGKRNVGGIIGTINSSLAMTIQNNTVQANVVIAKNAAYDDSSIGDFVGGYRGNIAFTLVGDTTPETKYGLASGAKTIAELNTALAVTTTHKNIRII